MAIGEALEVLERTGAAAGHGELLVRFDEVTLVCTLRYSGEPLRLGAAEVDVAALLDTSDEEIIDAQMRQVSAQLVTRLADRVRAEGQAGAASLTLQFEH
jgi:hypothetical protein